MTQSEVDEAVIAARITYRTDEWLKSKKRVKFSYGPNGCRCVFVPDIFGYKPVLEVVSEYIASDRKSRGLKPLETDIWGNNDYSVERVDTIANSHYKKRTIK